jgi:sterol desaturase/sphingolipid hydroxylase (fatty acid hydroxylase superfamily)
MLIFLLHILGYDSWFYLSHILLHSKYFWFIHKIHHEKKRPTIWDTNHAHWSESIIQSVGVGLPFLFYTPNWTEFGLAWLFIIIRGYARHDSRFNWLVGDHHLIHHEVGNANYGDFYIDWIFGTVYKVPKHIT